MGAILDFYRVWDDAYEFFNEKMFDGKLEDVGFVVEKQKGSHAYYHPGQYVTRNGQRLHKLSMNESSLARTDAETMSTLVHEMAHHWQHLFGSPGRGKYHNAEWASKMRELGLAPKSATTGDKGTGDRVTHEIVEGGPFDEAFKEWEARGLVVGWHGHKQTPAQKAVAKKKSKTKYYNPINGTTVWGKPGLLIFDENGGQYEEELS